MDLDSDIANLTLDTEPVLKQTDINKDHFNVRKFLGRGCYSLVYEVEKNTGIDIGTQYALKKFFLLSSSAMKCVLRERQILARLAECEQSSHFLPTLFYSLWIPYSPIFIINEGCGRDLFDLIKHAGQMEESYARFYLAEIISGLEIVHSMGIVHLDLKPENILFRSNGHIFIADFDRSYDFTISDKVPTDDDFTGTPLFMAPEIASGQIISTKADVWSLGILVAEMVSGPVRPAAKDTADDFHMARKGTYKIRGLNSFTKPMQSFFSATLKVPVRERIDLNAMKGLRFLKFVNWALVSSCKLKPPYDPMDFEHRPSPEDRKIFAEESDTILRDAFAMKPSINYGGRKLNNKDDDAMADLRRETPSTLDGIVLNQAFTNFAYIHPSLRPIEIAYDEIKDLKKTPTQARPRTRNLSVGD
ncbi:Serine/threonine-protein kinase 32A [Cichlidogyrus casuarinus]|uniref:Serine/threonine-protein kinase 32A n=1 Tax=Cichlidogyrus casuarinus TaxID=1844966 RepID=A0ABD2QDA5_9PLAT